MPMSADCSYATLVCLGTSRDKLRDSQNIRVSELAIDRNGVFFPLMICPASSLTGGSSCSANFRIISPKDFRVLT
jgi:hypothetical protein